MLGFEWIEENGRSMWWPSACPPPLGPPDTTNESVGSKILCEAKSIADSLTALPVYVTNTIVTNAYGIEIEGRTAVNYSMRLVASQPCYLAWPEHRSTLPASCESLGASKLRMI
ncbi:hypothetical protein BGZ82_008333 [Podila clonocystis]|nr:hypothetical protein BGZ82_008333 [Podila clonocystis]